MSIHYKFKSGKEFNTITFDGTFIPLSELKQRIIVQKKLGKGTDFTLEVTNAASNQVYEDDSTPIPRNTSVIVCRVPTAAKTNKPIETQPQVLRKPTITTKLAPTEDDEPPPSTTETLDDFLLHEPSPEPQPLFDEEEAANLAQLDKTASTWSASLDAAPKPAYGDHSRFGSEPPRPSYTCHRCGLPGHYINQCPTNGDESFNIHVIKSAVGIPKTMLAPVPQGQAASSGTLRLPGGGLAKMVPNEKAFEKERQALTTTTTIPDEFLCRLCKKIFKDAMCLPCCGISFCAACIQPAPGEQIECPLCKKRVAERSLVPNQALRQGVDKLKRELIEQKKAAERKNQQLAEAKAKLEPVTIITEPPTQVCTIDYRLLNGVLDNKGSSEGGRGASPSRSFEANLSPSPKRYKPPSRTPSPRKDGEPPKESNGSAQSPEHQPKKEGHERTEHKRGKHSSRRRTESSPRRDRNSPRRDYSPRRGRDREPAYYLPPSGYMGKVCYTCRMPGHIAKDCPMHLYFSTLRYPPFYGYDEGYPSRHRSPIRDRDRRSHSPRRSPSPKRRRSSPKRSKRSSSPKRSRRSPSPKRSRRSPSPKRSRRSPSPKRSRRS